MPKWLVELEKKLDEYAAEGSHSKFRVFLTSDPSKTIPIGILSCCIKVTNEPPAGLKANLNHAWCFFLKRIHSRGWLQNKEYFVWSLSLSSFNYDGKEMKLTFHTPIGTSNFIVTSQEIVLTAFGPFHGWWTIAHDTCIVTAHTFEVPRITFWNEIMAHPKIMASFVSNDVSRRRCASRFSVNGFSICWLWITDNSYRSPTCIAFRIRFASDECHQVWTGIVTSKFTSLTQVLSWRFPCLSNMSMTTNSLF